MSKVQEKDAALLSNLSGSEIANELDSRLRDLEKNIAVAREFIKLADESYSELRHKWNLLHEEVRSIPQSQVIEPTILANKKKETRSRTKKQAKPKETELTTLDEPRSPSSPDISPKPETHVKRAKNSKGAKKEQGIIPEDTGFSRSRDALPTLSGPRTKTGKERRPKLKPNSAPIRNTH